MSVNLKFKIKLIRPHNIKKNKKGQRRLNNPMRASNNEWERKQMLFNFKISKERKTEKAWDYSVIKSYIDKTNMFMKKEETNSLNKLIVKTLLIAPATYTRGFEYWWSNIFLVIEDKRVAELTFSMEQIKNRTNILFCVFSCGLGSFIQEFIKKLHYLYLFTSI